MDQNIKSPFINGWLVVDKPSGIGSTDIVNIIKKKLGVKKVGHGGTLDPDATGLLPVAIGEATKTIRFTENLLKTYEFTVSFGFATDTDDASGKIIGESKKRPNTKEIRDSLQNFKGLIQQLPPKLSAIKVNGKRAYDLFHKGQEFQLSARKIFISDFEIINRKNNDTIDLKVICGKGCYVRSLARDLGITLGCYGYAVNIRRTEYGPFYINNTIALDKLKIFEKEQLVKNIISTNILLKQYPDFKCNEENLNILLNGNPIKLTNLNYKNHKFAWTHYNGVPLAIGKIKNFIFYPFRVLNILKNDNNL